MTEEEIPRSWVGRRVEALILSPWGGALTAWTEEGTLEYVTDLGIVASLEQEDEPTAGAFYPWSAVLRLRLKG